MDGIPYCVFCNKVNNPNSKTGFVFGGFYLITREAYESLGTHQSIKHEIAEDLAIGEKLKHGKYRLRMFLGEENIQTSWALDSASLHSALQRTVLSAFQKQPILTCASAALQAIMLILPWVVLPYSAYWFLLFSSHESGMQTGGGTLLSILPILNLLVLGMIFISSFTLTCFSLRQGSLPYSTCWHPHLHVFLFSVRLFYRSSKPQLMTISYLGRAEHTSQARKPYNNN